MLCARTAALPQLCWSMTLLQLSPTVRAGSCKGDAVYSMKFGNDTFIGFAVACKCGLTFLTFWPPIMSRKHVSCWNIEHSVWFHWMRTFLVLSSSWTFLDLLSSCEFKYCPTTSSWIQTLWSGTMAFTMAIVAMWPVSITDSESSEKYPVIKMIVWVLPRQYFKKKFK